MYVIADSPEAYGRNVACARSPEHGESVSAHAAARSWTNISLKVPPLLALGSAAERGFTDFLRSRSAAGDHRPSTLPTRTPKARPAARRRLAPRSRQRSASFASRMAASTLPLSFLMIAS